MIISKIDFKMLDFIAFIVFGIGVVTGDPTSRIVGGALTQVNQYPEIVALLYANTGTNYRQTCGGTILTTKVILTAARCPHGDPVYRWRVRVGSSYANSGGTVYALTSITKHPNFNDTNFDSDIALMHPSSPIIYSNIVKAAFIAGLNYNLVDNQVVWAAGWGRTSPGGSQSEQLRHIQVWTINQATCKSLYAVVGFVVTDNMLCAGWLNVGGRDQCQGDAGGPLYHNGVVVGVCSWGRSCGDPYYPGVNTRVSRYTSWIQSNALN